MSLQQQLSWDQSRTLWAAALNPIIAVPMLSGTQLTNIVVNTSPTAIPHGLNRMQLGWFITDNNTNCTVWRTAPFNNTNLTLTASAMTTLSIWVF